MIASCIFLWVGLVPLVVSLLLLTTVSSGWNRRNCHGLVWFDPAVHEMNNKITNLLSIRALLYQGLIIVDNVFVVSCLPFWIVSFDYLNITLKWVSEICCSYGGYIDYCVDSLYPGPWSLSTLILSQRCDISSCLTWTCMVVNWGCIHLNVASRWICIHWIVRPILSCCLYRVVIRASPWVGSIRWFVQ